MKSPTSLIRFRNAVGVVLALSAVFAVVISAVTFTQDRALAQDPPTVTLTVDDETVEEGATVQFTVTLSVAVDAAVTEPVVIPITVTDGTAVLTDDYTVPDPSSVTFTGGGGATETFTITTVGDQDASEPAETFVVSLGDLPAGYDAGETTSFTITITDDDNATPSGQVRITIPDGDDDGDVPDEATGAVVGEELTADVSVITDTDHVDDPDTTPADEGVLSDGFSYSWQRDDGDSNPLTLNEVVGIEKTYTPTEYDVGETLILVVMWTDKYGNGDDMPDLLETATTLTATAYDEARPFIIKGDTNTNMRRDPGDVLTRDTSGMLNASSQLIDADGNLVDGNTFDDTDDEITNQQVFPITAITYTWHRDDGAGGESMPIMYDDDDNDASPDIADIRETYTLDDPDVAKSITLVATYSVTTAEDDTDTADVDESMTEKSLTSDSIGRVYSTNDATGQPTISGIGQVGQTLTASVSGIMDVDKLEKVMYTYEWKRGDVVTDVTSTTYPLTGADIGEKITVTVSFTDDLGDPYTISSAQTISIGGSPGAISEILPGIRGITVSGGDTVGLEVLVYGLQGSLDQDLGIGVDFDWVVDPDAGTISFADEDKEYEATFKAPTSPGNYTLTASLGAVDCQPEVEGDENACKAEFEVQVRRPSADGPEQPAPANPPGEIPSILADSDGNQYEVFTPVEGGTFTGEGYSLKVDAGAVPNGEFIGIRMSDEGAASNVGMTHQRYTLGGNMYAISAVDGSGAAVSSYVLDDAALACVPLPDELRSNISDLALVAINGDGSLTILAAQVRIRSAGNIVCGALSNLPASVAVGSSGAPAAIPTPTPEPTAVPPPTGGTAPASSMVVLWSMLLGVAVFALGSVLVIARRREGARNR